MTRIGALILAAGASERLGTPKQLLLDASGTPLVSTVVHAVRDAGFDPVVVVVGAHAEGVTHALIRDAAGVFLVPHRGWSEGMGSSIRAGIAAMSTHSMMTDVAGVLIAPCDMPTADVAHFRRLHDAACVSDGGPAAGSASAVSAPVVRVASEYATIEGKSVTRGIPAVFPRTDWPTLLMLQGDRGAKPMLDLPDTVTVRLDGGTFDLDTAADVSAWRASS